METTAGAGYAVIVTEAPVTVKAKKTDGTTVDIKVLDSTGQHTFIAMSGETLFEGGSVELGLVQGPFDPARALGVDNGGAGAPVYTLGSNNTYRLTVSATTAEMTRPAAADDWFHVRMPLHLHGNNLHHGAGASIFAQGSIVSSMSARGFYVENSGVRIVELDSDAAGNAYMELNGARVLTEAGERIITQEAGSTAPIAMLHATWHSLDSASTAVSIAPSAVSSRALSMQLLLAPTADLSTGWLTSSDTAKPIYWPFGEPVLVGGYRYCITLVQLSDMIVANMTPLGAV